MSSSSYSWTDDGSTSEEDLAPADHQRQAAQLLRSGYVVLRVFPQDQLERHRRNFDAALRNLREYRQQGLPPDSWQYAKTGFGALATPSSYHNEAVRYMRLAAHERAIDTLRAYDAMQPYGLCGRDPRAPWNATDLVERPRAQNGRLRPRRVQMLVDRMVVRVAGQRPGAESWHRDVAYTGEDDAVTVFGGWLALTDQKASLVPGTHMEVPGPVGFASLQPDAARKAERNKQAVEVPAGCLLVMHQNIVHEVVSTPHTGDDRMRRLFTGWRLTYGRRPLCEFEIPRGDGRGTRMKKRRDGPSFSQSLDETLLNQAGFKLPSDQFPDVYNEKGVDMPVQHAGLRRWLDTYIRKELFGPILAADGSRVKFDGGAPPRHMLPMASTQEGTKWQGMNVRTIAAKTGQAPYPPYEAVEAAILRPITFAAAQRLREECGRRRRALEATF